MLEDAEKSLPVELSNRLSLNRFFAFQRDIVNDELTDLVPDLVEDALENPTEMANFYSAMAYPGSPLHNQARVLGLDLPTTYSGYSQHSYDTLNLSNAHLTSAEILAFRDKAWDTYHSSDKYLSLMKNKFGQKAVDELDSTKKVKLKRKLLGD